jgi:hypothetical protein
MIRELRRRLDRLERAIFGSMPGPWPPAEGSMTFALWDALSRPGERGGFMDMYQQRAADFWKGKI